MDKTKINLSIESSVSIRLEWWDTWKRIASENDSPPKHISEIIYVLEAKGLRFDLKEGNFLR